MRTSADVSNYINDGARYNANRLNRVDVWIKGPYLGHNTLFLQQGS